MLREASGEHSLSQAKMMNVLGEQAPKKTTEMLKKSRTHPQRPSPKNP
jgi:hypothetical protein